MKSGVFTFTLISSLIITFATYAEGSKRHYISNQDLTITEQGIFVKSNDGLVPLNEIGYDYQRQSFYTGEDSRTELIKCGYCGLRTWDVISKICYNPDCPYYPWSYNLSN